MAPTWLRVRMATEVGTRGHIAWCCGHVVWCCTSRVYVEWCLPLACASQALSPHWHTPVEYPLRVLPLACPSVGRRVGLRKTVGLRTEDDCWATGQWQVEEPRVGLEEPNVASEGRHTRAVEEPHEYVITKQEHEHVASGGATVAEPHEYAITRAWPTRGAPAGWDEAVPTSVANKLSGLLWGWMRPWPTSVR